MSINKTIKLGWDGVEYSLKITMAVIDKIDDDVNLVKLVAEYEKGDARISKIARLLATLLNEAGATVTVEQVFHALFGSGEIDRNQIKLMMTGIFSAIFPQPKKKSTTRSRAIKKKSTRKKTS